MRGSRLRFALTMVAIVAAIVGAILAGGIGLDRLCPPTWTLAFYLDGSDSLLSEQQKNLREIVAGRAGFPDSRVVVCLDRGRNPLIPIPHGWEGPRIFEINGSYREILARPLADTDDLFSGNRSNRMAAFFSQVRERYPSRHTAFFIVGHGQGWNTGPSVEGREAGFNAPDIARALSFSGPDILCLDLCLMSDLESVYQLRHSAAYLVVSQGLLPSGGQNYQSLLGDLGKMTSRAPEAVADRILGSMNSALRERRLNGAVTLVRTGPELDAFVQTLKQSLGREPLGDTLCDAGTRGLRLPAWGGMAHQLIDLKGLVTLLNRTSDNDRLTPEAFIVRSVSTHPHYSGLSLYCPSDKNHYDRLRSQYRNLDFNTDTENRWLNILDARFGAAPSSE